MSCAVLIKEPEILALVIKINCFFFANVRDLMVVWHFRAN